MSSAPNFIQFWQSAPWAAAISLSIAISLPLPGFAQAPGTTPDPETERIEAFRADFVRAPDIGLWFQRRADRGLIVDDVATSGAIAKAGFMEGDRILAVNDQKVATEVEFIRSIFAEPVRLRPVKIRVIRDQRELVLVVAPFRLIEELIAVSGEPLEPLGIVLDQKRSQQVVVAKVMLRSPAFHAGLRPGDEILSIDRIPLTERDHFARLILALKPGAVATLSVQRGERERFIELEMPHVPERKIIQPPIGKKPDVSGKQRVDPGGVSPGGEVPAGTRKNRVDPGGVSPGGEVPPGTKKKRVDPGGVSPGGEAPRNPKPVPPT